MQNAQREPQNKCLSLCFRFLWEWKHNTNQYHTQTHTQYKHVNAYMHALEHKHSFTHFEIRPTTCRNVCQVVYRDGNCSPLYLCSTTHCFCWNVVDSLENIGVLYCCKHELLTGKFQLKPNATPNFRWAKKSTLEIFLSIFFFVFLNQLNILNLNRI